MNATGSQAIVVATTSGALSVGKDMVLIFRTRKKERKKKKPNPNGRHICCAWGPETDSYAVPNLRNFWGRLVLLLWFAVK
jgi:hypothetical protein